MKFPFSVKIGPSLPWAGRNEILEAPRRYSSFSTYGSAFGNTSTGMGNLLPSRLTSFAGIDDDKGFAAAPDQQLFFEHGSATPFYQIVVGVHFICPVKCPVGTFVPEGG